MTTNQTIDGVQRELLERLAKALMVFTGHDSGPNLRHNYGDEWWKPLDAMREELRAMLVQQSPCEKSQVDSSVPPQDKSVATVIAKTWLVGSPRAVALNASGLELADGTKLYAEQPAPVALTQDAIDRIVPSLNPEPDRDEFHCEWALWSDRERIRSKLSTLLTANPAPVAVVLPARPRADEEEYERMTDYEKGLLHGGIELWDKIDKATRLNAKSR